MNADYGLKIALVGAFSTLMMTAHAETPAASDNELEEVVVTARLRSESLQQVPVAVTAFSAKALQDAAKPMLNSADGREVPCQPCRNSSINLAMGHISRSAKPEQGRA